MSKAIEDYVKFNVLGADNENVTPEDRELIRKLNQRKHILLRYKDTTANFVIETYSKEKQLEIFNGIKQRQGLKCRITFSNDRNDAVEIIGAKLKDDKVLLECIYCKRRTVFNMWLSTFLSEVWNNHITKVKPDGFNNSYLCPISVSLERTYAELKELEDKYNKVYQSMKDEVTKEYYHILNRFNRVRKEGKAERYQMSDEESLAKAKSFKGLKRVKNYWNTKLSEEEKKTLFDWICTNIYSIRVYGLTNGQSGNTLLNEYSNIGNVKYREIKTNSEGQVTSQDSIVAHISFKQIADAPMDILKKVVSTKGRNENIFYNNRLNDKNLALFLLSEYHDKGFKAGVRNLYKEIKTA